MRRHFDVVAESLRSDSRAIAEVLAMSNKRSDRHFGQHGGASTASRGAR
jgi:hypothetical protein